MVEKRSVNPKSPIASLIIGYISLVVFGFLLLSVPIFQSKPTSFIDNFFVSASAISTTGLATVSISDSYRFMGELIVLILIQFGGIGYMTFGSFIVLVRRKQISKSHETLIKNDFGLPDDISIAGFIRTVVYFTFLVESLGAACLYWVFVHQGVRHPLWNAVFHSISAFCTAGFSLFNNSFESFSADPLLNITIFVLSFLGAVGFLVVLDLWLRIRGVKKTLTLTTKIILSFSVAVIAAGSLLLLQTEPYFQGFFSSRIMEAVFQSMTAMTTVGFNTVPISQLSHGVLFLMTVLMIVGASPAGTGGGIKSTTIVAVICQMISVLKGRKTVKFMNYRIPDYRVQQATAAFTFYVMFLTAGIYLLNLTDNKHIFDIMFEATSAIGTVGLSTGITSTLSFWGKWVVIALMMFGRIGPLSIGLAIFFKRRTEGEIEDGMGGWMEDIVVD
ncbi:MAG: potassium transporter KtrB [Candidatus Omnitrophica bacterium]|nr:potassium transporter KtrB [Candidatus Omnitrophota bacterium]